MSFTEKFSKIATKLTQKFGKTPVTVRVVTKVKDPNNITSITKTETL